MDKFNLIGAAIDACAGTVGAADTPDRLKQKWLGQLGLKFSEILRYTSGRNNIPELTKYFTLLANSTKSALDNKQFPLVIGGDHSSAIGTWSGVAAHFKQQEQNLGLIWLDAHMDSHTPESSLSGNIHGMPVAVLLGHGYKEFTTILGNQSKILPENIVLIGIRSFEEAEVIRLNQLGVKVYYNYDVTERGFAAIFKETYESLINKVDKIGLTIDLDGFDPEFAPGVGTAEPDGINFTDFIKVLKMLDPNKLAALEITEGNDHLDPSGKTMQCIIDIIHVIQKLKN